MTGYVQMRLCADRRRMIAANERQEFESAITVAIKMRLRQRGPRICDLPAMPEPRSLSNRYEERLELVKGDYNLCFGIEIRGRNKDYVRN